MAIHHAIDYVELSVADLDASRAFYAQAFGWQFNDYGPEYAGFRDDPRAEEEGGGLSVSQDRPGRPFVLLYSDDLDASVRAVEAAGGAVVQGPYEFPGGRRFHFTDPNGNELGVWAAQ